ncbi:TonB-dependent receptor domain-containing protein [Roseivirga sp. BDSF3-8]|uniref:TonB-dependent receptor n=1 Tax=Roseivirga sp. BDSF3-8 TaxID=3241598 RepID=UPI0035319061
MRKLLLCLIICTLTSIAYGQRQSNFTGTFNNTPLSEVFSQLEAHFGIRFFYQSGWLEGQTLSLKYENAPLDLVLEEMFKRTEFAFLQPEPYAVVLLKNPEEEKERQEMEDYVTSSNIERVLIGNPADYVAGKEVTLSGVVREGKTADRIPGASVEVSDSGTGSVTDNRGRYTVRLKSGAYLLRFSTLNLEAEEYYVQIYQDGTLDVNLFEKPVELGEVVVEGERLQQNVESTSVGKQKLTIETIENMPAFLGEVDVVKSITLLPGVSTVGEGSGGFNVRGGSTDQNLILLDDAIIFNPSHLFGFFSVFNKDAVRDVTFYRGGVPAEYGGRVSSVLDIRQREGDKQAIHAQGGIGLVTSRLAVEGPIIKDKTSFLVAGRATYSDWLLRAVKDVDIRNSSAGFYDGTVKLSHDFNSRTKLNLTSYISGDRFSYASDTTYRWRTFNNTLSFRRLINENLFTELALTDGNYSYQVNSPDESLGFDLEYRIDYQKANWRMVYSLAGHDITGGLEGLLYQFEPGSITPSGSESAVNPFSLDSQKALEASAYIQDDFEISEKWAAMVGLRYSRFNAMGPGEITLYENNENRTLNTIAGTQLFSDWETIASFGGIEPRVSLRYKLGASSSLKASYQRMRQYIHLVSNTLAISPLDIYLPSSKYFRPQVGDQYSVGYFNNLKDNTYEVSLEVYYKDIQDVVDFKDGANLILNPYLETDLLQGQGWSYGSELLLKKNKGRLTGWASYTYSRTWRQFDGQNPESRINDGNKYPANQDRPHDLKVVGNYQISRKWTLGANVIYSSGRAYTAPEARYEIEGFVINDYSDRNGYRTPPYHRLDISFTYEPNLRLSKKYEDSWTFAVYNVYGRKNPYSVFFQDFEGSPPQAYKFSVLGVPFPSVTYNFKF